MIYFRDCQHDFNILKTAGSIYYPLETNPIDTYFIPTSA
jgi:hypothetical protein